MKLKLPKLRTVPCIAVLALLGCATPNTPGSTLGEWLDKGARRASKAELLPRFVGKRLPMVTPAGLKSDLAYKADGTFEGTMQLLKGPNSGATSRNVGTWTMDDSGKFCMNEDLIDWKRKVSKCYFIYLADDQIVVSTSDADRNADVAIVPK